MKKIVLYGINYTPEPIGVGRFSGELGEYLAGKNIQVEVITAVPHYPGWQLRNGFTNRYSVERKPNERIIRCPILLKKNLRGIWRLVAPFSFALSSAPVALFRILVSRPDVVLCVEPTIMAAPVALLAGKLAGARCYLHVQDLEIDAAFAVNHVRGAGLKRFAHAVERIVMRSFDRVITISQRMAEKIASKGVPQSRIEIVRNWVDLNRIRPLADVSSYREELGLTHEIFIALYAGNVGPKQALPVVLQAARRLRCCPEILFLIVGDGPEKADLIAQCQDLKNVKFLPIQPEEKLCELLNLANVHLLPQLRGAADLVLPSKLGGMLASGKPCLVMADRGTELFDFLDGGALLLMPGDAEGLADTILKLSQRELTAPCDPSRAEAFDARRNLPAFMMALGLEGRV